MTATETGTPAFAHPGLGAGVDPEPEPGFEDRAGRDLNPLAVLAEIAEPLELHDTVIPHRYREGWAVRYSTEIDLEDIKRWRKAAKAPGKAGRAGEVDELKLACIVLGNMCEAIMRGGVELTDGQAQPLSFRSPEMRRLYDASTVADVVRKFYGHDPYLVGVLDALLVEAGVGDDVETLDPTLASSG